MSTMATQQPEYTDYSIMKFYEALRPDPGLIFGLTLPFCFFDLSQRPSSFA